MGGVASGDLLGWFRAAARVLPWRSTPRDPYRVVVSELMLQQTQVERVVPRFEAFMDRFPSLASLAAADETEVVEMWSGLGYYRRARMLHRLARTVVAKGGELPRSADVLQRLPGIGPYTAAAVASMAFDERVPVLDGNTMRVGARVLALAEDPRSAAGGRSVGKWIMSLMGDAPPGAVNEALMELGATVCTPVTPRCELCPLAGGCAARCEGRPEAYPPPRPRRAGVRLCWTAACCVAEDGSWLLRRIDDGPILLGLWLPPLHELADGNGTLSAASRLPPGLEATAAEAFPTIRHRITHRRIEVVPVRMAVRRGGPLPDGWCWADPRAPGLPTSSLLAKLVAAIGGGCR